MLREISVSVVPDLGWIEDEYRDLARMVAIAGKDSKGRKWVRICFGWFMHDDTGDEWATYWEYWINDLGEVILRLAGYGDINFPLSIVPRKTAAAR